MEHFEIFKTSEEEVEQRAELLRKSRLLREQVEQERYQRNLKEKLAKLDEDEGEEFIG